MFTKDNLHHARIEDIVSDLLSRIETLESNRQEIQSTMQNDTIIKSLSEKIERLEAENDNLKTPPIEKALNTVFGINPDSIVDFSPKDLSLSNHYMLLSIESLNELKAENDRQFEWNQENLKKIGVLEAANSLLNHVLNNFGDTERSELLSKIALREKEVNAQLSIIKGQNDIISNIPQWKNIVKDGLPVFDSDPVAVITICGGIMATHNTLEEEDMEAINNLDEDFYYFLIPRVNATN